VPLVPAAPREVRGHAMVAMLIGCGLRRGELLALLEGKVGNNAEMRWLQRFVPGYSEAVVDWLWKHIREFGSAK
jgi:site-specific recombinase XerD